MVYIINKKSICEFYKGTNYNEFRVGSPRPKEWHLPKFIYETFNNESEFLRKYLIGKKIIVPLDYEDMKVMRTTLLHESLFSFYKAFYNYLAAKNLYSSGALHWIEITIYYAKFYLAEAINTLCGVKKYQINSEKFHFVDDIYKLINEDKYKKLVEKNNPNKVDLSEENVSYTIFLNLDINHKIGSLEFSNDRVKSHIDIWKIYSKLNLNDLGLTKMTYEEFHDNGFNHLSKQRNEENYSFDGYMQVDFNLDSKIFPQYFERDFIKQEEEFVFDDKIGIVLGVFSQIYILYKELAVFDLPIEKEKFKFMIDYMIGNKALMEKLLDLCDKDFPIENKYIDEMNNYYSWINT